MHAAALQLPSPYEFVAPPQWRAIEFISDLHLHESRPATFEAWARYLQHTDADTVLILGDLFEVWVGDDARVDGSFEARCMSVLTAAATRHHIGFMAGNRDFLLGAQALRDCGAIAMRDPTLLTAWGQRVLLSHGDMLCIDDLEYQKFRAQVRTDAWRDAFLARPLATRRALAGQMRDSSERRKSMQAPADWIDVDTPTAVAWLHAAGSRDLVHGHTHRPATEVMAPGFTRHVLTDWDTDTDPPRAEALRLTRDGFSRRSALP